MFPVYREFQNIAHHTRSRNFSHPCSAVTFPSLELDNLDR